MLKFRGKKIFTILRRTYLLILMVQLLHFSAVIEHTNQVIFLEDDDVAAVSNGSLTIHRVSRSIDDSTVREVVTLKMELQQIMKGENTVNSEIFVRDLFSRNFAYTKFCENKNPAK